MLTGHIIEEIQLFAANLIELAHTMMCFEHLLPHSFIITALQCIADIPYTLGLFNHILSTHKILC